MGRPKVKIIDDSQEEVKEGKQKPSKKAAKLEPVKTISEVERTTKDNELSQEQGTKQTHSEPPLQKKSQKPGKVKPRSQKYQEAVEDLDKTQSYPVNEAIDLVKKVSYSKFTGTLEAHINTVQTGIRGLVSLPFVSGKKLRILAFGADADKSGADIIGNEEIIEEISKGKIAFDLVVTNPAWMPKLAKVARILGPRSLMPNPKNGTITEDLKKAVEGFQAGKTEYKTESKAPVIHIALGKLNQPNEELTANIKALIQTVGKTRVKKLTVSPTMGPAVKINLSSL